MPPRKRKAETLSSSFEPPAYFDKRPEDPLQISSVWPTVHITYRWIDITNGGNTFACTCPVNSKQCRCNVSVDDHDNSNQKTSSSSGGGSGSSSSSSSSVQNTSYRSSFSNRYAPFYRKAASDRSTEEILDEGQMIMDNYLYGESAIGKTRRQKKKYLHSIRLRIVGKGGRIRNNLNGKRKGNSARSVITGDAYESMDEIYIPQCIANVLSKQCRVNLGNIASLTKLLYQKKIYYVITSSGETIRLKNVNVFTFQIHIGDIVVRHLLDGDLVLCNRQPSLHKMSTLAFRVRIFKDKNMKHIGLPFLPTNPFNADFDGDEMNLHVPDSEEAEAEAEHLIMAHHHLITCQTSKPIISFKHNSILGFYYLSKRDTFIEKKDFFSLLLHFESDHDADMNLDLFEKWKREDHWLEPAIRCKDPKTGKWKEYFTGAQLLQCFFPENYSNKIEKMSRFSACTNSEDPIIDRGTWISGLFKSQHLSTTEGSLVQIFAHDYKTLLTSRYMDGMQRITNEYLMLRGCSVGLDDVVDNEFQESIEPGLERVSYVVQSNPEHVPISRIQWLRDHTVSYLQSTFLDKLKSEQLCASALGNGVLDLALSGTKGSGMHILNMGRMIGQQYSENGPDHCPFPYTSHLASAGRNPGSFIISSYLKGLSWIEFFYHTRCGRRASSTTVRVTADCGYLYRQMYNHLNRYTSDIMGRVQDEHDQILQFSFAGDDAQPETLEYIPYRLFKYTTESELRNAYGSHDSPELEVQQLVQDWKSVQHIQGCVQRFGKQDKSFQSCVPFPRIILQCYHAQATAVTIITHPRQNHLQLALEPHAIFHMVQSFIHTHFLSDHRPSSHFFCLLARDYLSTASLTDKKMYPLGWTLIGLSNCLQAILKRYEQSKIEQGRSVGAEAAQSIGEPTTQMSMKVFHQTGQSSEVLDDRVPYLKRILGGGVNRDTPGMLLCTDSSIKTFEQAKQCAQSLIVKPLSYFMDMTKGLLLKSSREWLQEYKNTFSKTVIQRFLEFEDGLSSSHVILQCSFNQHRISDFSTSLPNIILYWSQQISKELKMSLSYFHFNYMRVCWDSNSHLFFHFSILFYNKFKESLLPRPAFLNEREYEEMTMVALKDYLLSFRCTGIGDTSDAVCLQEPLFIQSLQCKRWMIRTKGSCYYEWMSLPFIDSRHCHLNRFKDWIQHYGILACRQFILYSLEQTMNNDKMNVHTRHLHLLADAMTRYGFLIPITRQGIRAMPHTSQQFKSNFLADMSFEVPFEQIFKAALFEQKDELKSIISNCFLGNVARFGSGVVHLESCKTMLPFQQEYELKAKSFLPIFTFHDPSDMVFKSYFPSDLSSSYPFEEEVCKDHKGILENEMELGSCSSTASDTLILSLHDLQSLHWYPFYLPSSSALSLLSSSILDLSQPLLVSEEIQELKQEPHSIELHALDVNHQPDSCPERPMTPSSPAPPRPPRPNENRPPSATFSLFQKKKNNQQNESSSLSIDNTNTDNVPSTSSPPYSVASPSYAPHSPTPMTNEE